METNPAAAAALEYAGEKEPLPDDTSSPPTAEPQSEYPTGFKLISIVFSLFITMFLFALDRTVLGVAIPQITSEFDSLADIGYYSSAILLTQACFMLLVGKIFTLYSIKWVYLGNVVVFEIGSALCGAAPSSAALIVGRAIAGIGCAGIMSGGMVILTYVVPLAKRPLYQGLFGAVFGIASVMGPLLGGVFTDHLSWRWCFYINLPCGALVILALALLLNLDQPERPQNLTLREAVLRLDPIGTACFIPGLTCLLLALNWGGVTYAWSDGGIIALFVLAGVFLPAFIGVQIWLKENATVPPRVFIQRSVLSAFWYQICAGSSMLVIVYYLPLWFQAIQGVSAVESGVRLLALLLALVVGTFASGAITYLTGYYTPAMIFSSVVTAVGAGLLSTLQVDSGKGAWIGYQIVFGFGMGVGLQQPSLAIQTVLEKKDVPVGSSLVVFGLSVGGTLFLSVAQTVFSNSLASNLSSSAGALNAESPTKIGATELRNRVPPEELDVVLEAFNGAITKTFYVAVALACVSIVGALTMEWKSVKKEKERTKEVEAAQEDASSAA